MNQESLEPGDYVAVKLKGNRVVAGHLSVRQQGSVIIVLATGKSFLCAPTQIMSMSRGECGIEECSSCARADQRREHRAKLESYKDDPPETFSEMLEMLDKFREE